MSEQERIAQDATFQIACAMEHINWLRGVLHVLEDRLKQGRDEHYATVANLAIFNADDWHNQLDCERESLETRTVAAFGVDNPAPRNATSEKRGAPTISGQDRSLAERLLLARESASLSQADLAVRAGVEQTTISQIESGKTKRSTFLPELARACGVSIEWLAFGPEVDA